MRYRARAPLRIDFGGDWTDGPPYAEREGGAVLSAAITRYVHGYIARPEGQGLIRAMRGDRRYLSYTLDVPDGAGLGASSAQALLWVTLMRSSIENVSDRRELAGMALSVSEVLGLAGDPHDVYASAVGGITCSRFGATTETERLKLDPEVLDELRQRLLLVYSGTPGQPARLKATLWPRYAAGEAGVSGSLAMLSQLATEMRDLLAAGDVDGLAQHMAEHWERQKELDPLVSTGGIEGIIDVAVKHGAAGWKACGAGGGGCILLLSKVGEAPRLRLALEQRRIPLIDFDFDTYGVFLTK